MNDLKENLYKLMREMNSSLKNEILKVYSTLNEKSKENAEKINLTILKNEELIDKLINMKNNSEIINQLNISQKKLSDMIMTQELRIKELMSSNQRIISNYEKIITNNLTVPGLIGNSCTYRTISDYITHNIDEIEKIKAEKETDKRLLDDIKYKLDGFMKNILNIINSSITRCNNYTDNKQKFLEEFIENKFVEINEKNFDFRAQIFTNINDIKKQVNDFEIKIIDLKDMKNAIKNELDNILIDFKEKLENQEEQLTKNLEIKFKEYFHELILQEKENKKESQNQKNTKQNKYKRRDNKSETFFSKSFLEGKKGSLFNIKASKNDNEKSTNEEFAKERSKDKKKTQIYTMNKDFKFLQMVNKIDEKDDLSESIHSQKINILNDSNENIFMNNEEKEEENNNKNREVIKKEKKSNQEPEIKIKDEEELEVIKSKNKEKFLNKKFIGKKILNNNDGENENEQKLEKIIEIDNDSKSRENKENVIEEKEEKKSDIKKDEKDNEEKINLIFRNENKDKPVIERKSIKIKKDYEIKEDENYNLNLNEENEENIKNSNKEKNLSLTNILDINTIQKDILDDVKKNQIPELINNQKENNPKFHKIQKNNFKTRNYTFQNINTYSSQNNVHSFNNMNKEMKLTKIKSEIEPMNNSSKNDQNSKTYIYFYKDKGKNKELDLKAISCKRTELQGTPLKLYIKEKKLENKSNLPRVYCNFKYINLGSNVHFQRNVIQIVHPKNKTNENKKSIIDFSNSLIDTYKLYQKKKKENKNIFIFNNNIYQNSQNKFSLNDSKKSDSELKKEVVKVGKLLNFKNNNSKNT